MTCPPITVAHLKIFRKITRWSHDLFLEVLTAQGYKFSIISRNGKFCSCGCCMCLMMAAVKDALSWVRLWLQRLGELPILLGSIQFVVAVAVVSASMSSASDAALGYLLQISASHMCCNDFRLFYFQIGMVLSYFSSPSCPIEHRAPKC